MQPKAILKIILLTLCYTTSNAQCLIYQNNAPMKVQNHDALSLLLAKTNNCPQSIQEFTHLLTDNNLRIKTTMVANRGKNNPILGSFSLFASISGTLNDGFLIKPSDFYLGYFTSLDQDELQLDQQPEPGKLLIELIAWDNSSQFFNFYELRGLTTQATRWFYRGNSQDALLDNRYLNRQPPPQTPKFGSRMRCSACHNAGGPILKEMETPHNDWWSAADPLVFSPNHPGTELSDLVNTLVEAEEFANEVQLGMQRLNSSIPFSQFARSLTLQEQLRPLFCTNEINIESDNKSGSAISIPSGFWLNPLLDKFNTTLSKPAYQHLLRANNMRFPETDFLDADHAWLTPVKGQNDINAIQQLIKDNLVTHQFVQSVLMIDFPSPVFSKARCELLQLVPQQISEDWFAVFIQELRQPTNSANAQLLARYLSNSEKYNHIYFQKILDIYKNQFTSKLGSEQGRQEAFAKLLQTRLEVLENELSQNPRGQILEPGFRVIFPVSIK